MNTFKMKVLLIINNRRLFSAVGKSILVWFFTNLIGCGVLYELGFFFLQSVGEFIQSLGLSLIFSSPALIIAAGVLYLLPDINPVFNRTAFSLFSILITAAGIILIVARVFHLEYFEVAQVLYPFAIAALACFFIVARKEFTPVKTSIK